MKIYLSSAEGAKNLDSVLLKIKGKKINLLVTFYYMRNKKHDVIMDTINKLNKVKDTVLLDSGAFTFLNEYKTSNNMQKGGQTKKTKTAITPQQYFDSYLEFLRKYHQYFDYITELDIDLLVGYDQVKKWREQILEIIPKKKLVLVFHKTIPNCYDEWKRWCVEYNESLLGIGGIGDGGVQVARLFKEAIKHNCKVQGFAMTKPKYMKAYPWYSVDSSSWNIGQRFGKVYRYDKNNFSMSQFQLSKIRYDEKVRELFFNEIYPKLDLGIPVQELLKNRSLSHMLDICNVYSFLKLEEALTNLWKARGFSFID